MKKTRVKLSSIVALICFIGCSIQIYHVTCIYLKFKVRSEVTYEYSDQVELPTIDIIIPMVMSINLTELFIRYPEQMASLCYDIHLKNVTYTIDNFNSECAHGFNKVAFLASLHIAPFIKVKDIKELTIDPRERVAIHTLNTGLINDQCEMTQYYSGFAVFLRIYCTEKAVLITKNINVIDSYGGNIAALNHSLGPYFGIRFNSQFDMPTYELSKYFMVTQRTDKQVALVWLRYEKIVTRSLPYPYESNCRYYNKLKVLFNCIANYTSHEGFLMKNIVYEWDSQPEHLGFVKPSSDDHEYEYEYEYEDKHAEEDGEEEGEGDDDADDDENEEKKDEEEKTEMQLTISHCVQQSLVPECEETTYLIGSEIASEQVNETSRLIFIEKPVTPIMYFNVHPNLLLSEYLIFVGSIIGTWFGYSIFDRLISILTWTGSKVIGKIRKNRESKRSIKIFIVRNSYYFSNPLLHSPSHSPIDTLKEYKSTIA